MELAFVHETAAVRVLFGRDRARDTRTEADLLGQRPLLVMDSVAASVSPALAEELAGAVAGAITEVRQHVPIDDAEKARALAKELGADVIVAFGGGSTVGLAKAIAMTQRLPILAVPTTYAGSEMTPVWGITADGEKTTGRDPGVAPRTVIYDPLLTLSMPQALTAASGLNALAHCVDAFWGAGRNPLTDTIAERGIASLAAGLPGAVKDGADLTAREQMQVGSWLAGAAFAAAGSSLHHKLCHQLGGRYNLPHAETHAVMLPWAAALAVKHDPEAGLVIARALGSDDVVGGLRSLGQATGAPSSLAELGLTESQAVALADDLDPAAMALPFTVSKGELRELLVDATADASGGSR